ncbi:cytochrome P450 [Coniophora puteana RWD-64-598 SS2]|uniref:Cytochrome P450 n=1 Tax=Coniophora puteana (strain RWD-64-598) TaxID=741705 RepID=A0A5M3MYQ2_CONPW|nr:cytochrome P450 [Coniophora puteana RWD-64-598 SS2]EIW84293.1 cytochrome P450 [Coniophora puteana RWD-64-598 SS2]
MTLSAVHVLCAAIVISGLQYWSSKRQAHQRLPPGPRPYPIVGNLWQLDKAGSWLTYTEWSKQYGEVFMIRFFNKKVIVLNSERVIKDLLDKRSFNYSDRPHHETIGLFGLGFRTVFMPYGDKWRVHRRVYHQALHPEGAKIYRSMQVEKAYQLLQNLLSSPDDYVNHFDFFSGSIVMSAMYGYNASPDDDPIIRNIKRVMQSVGQAETPELAAVLDAYPSLLKFPSWFPGAGVKRGASELRDRVKDMKEPPFEYVLKQMSAGTAEHSLVFQALTRLGDTGETAQMIKDASATAYSAGSETTPTTMQVWVLAMVLHPEVQARAQAEIDAVVGHDRLPDFSDRPSLPYIEAMLRETLRWHPIVPMSISHSALEDDIYEGMLIPKGATIIPNVWALSRNEEKYPSPERFLPERFLTETGEIKDENFDLVFGFGRRICPGRHLADASLWISIACILALFNFEKRKDAFGNIIDFEPKYTPTLASRPYPFPCSIVPRDGVNSEKLSKLIDV